jgi:hypothetical protein
MKKTHWLVLVLTVLVGLSLAVPASAATATLVHYGGGAVALEIDDDEDGIVDRTLDFASEQAALQYIAEAAARNEIIHIG